jgi:hypothetical protein
LVAADWIAAGSAEIALQAGQFDEAAARAQAAIEKARAIGGIFGEGMAQRTWGVALARLERPLVEQADEHLTAALALFEAGDCKVEIAHTNLVWGELLLDRSEWSRAAKRLELAVTGLQAAGLTRQAKDAEGKLGAVRKVTHA